MDNKYYKHALIILHDTIKYNYKSLTQEQCKLIGQCFTRIGTVEVTKEIVEELLMNLLDADLNWIKIEEE